MSMCQLCIALADHGYVHSDSGGDNVIFFLTSNLIADFDATGKKITPPTQTEINQLRTHSAQALCTIAKTCESAQQLLWPNLLEFICSENYNSVVTEIFKCLRIL
uniref:Uncharacterized protein n=1 Tax=Panagrolaimus sp. PS1159 TaxID=55785 RepID=A0AC35EW10_9BILA